MFKRHFLARAAAAAPGKSRLRAPPGMESVPRPSDTDATQSTAQDTQRKERPSERAEQQETTGFASRVQQMLREQNRLQQEQQQTASSSSSRPGAKQPAMDDDTKLPEEIEAERLAMEEEEGMLRKRREMLRFQDVGDGLDLFNWRRDTLGYVGGMFSPIEFMLNYYLKWELRYMTHDANRELLNCARTSNNSNSKISSSTSAVGGKLFDAPSFLHPVGVPFPTVPRMWWMGEGHKDAQDTGDRHAADEKGSAAKKSVANPTTQAQGRVFFAAASEFRRPTLVLMSPLGFDGAVCTDDEWISLAQSSSSGTGGWTFPTPTRSEKSVLRNLGMEIAPATSASSDKNSTTTSAPAHSHKHLTVLRLRTWAIRGTEQLGAWSTKRIASYYPFEVCKSAYAGVHLERSFIHSDLPIRNWQTTYAMLVDHRGHIRWVATGSPSQREAQSLHPLISQLEHEYMTAASAVGSSLRKTNTTRLPVASSPDGGQSRRDKEKESQLRHRAEDDESAGLPPVKKSIFRRLAPNLFAKIDAKYEEKFGKAKNK